MKLIELQSVNKKYKLGQTELCALKDINLSFDKGEFTAVWGPSGSGKTTLLNLIGTIDEPSSGTILLNGEDVSKMSDNQKSDYRNNRIGFIFQNFNLIPVLSAVENVMLPLQIRNVKTGVARKKAMDRLKEVGLEHLANNRPDKMSGGQRQRVAIARALVTDPDVVIADEPTANLDLVTSINIIEIMQKLNKKDQATFLFSTHDQRLLDRMNRLIQLEDGRMV
ncbi:MAG: ABC transporter ATP-binding protein [Desulfobacula sp.]|uniref:ABC transporter ATP-binding protein n=1 Tax=Desulfobacula sp. TaxID=2593537 RepID=UPI0025C5049B|nr:ABC transporter ATP-binding protein [Desulfobacula sp.]MCD4722584.1 ABC transporter ATP-binding protein [Desulfobacula sp.]